MISDHYGNLWSLELPIKNKSQGPAGPQEAKKKSPLLEDEAGEAGLLARAAA